MRKIINSEHIEGLAYESNLELKTVKNRESKNFGKEFIGGTLSVATDDAGLNIVPVHFSYVPPVFNSGKTNKTFGILKEFIEKGKTVIKDGAEVAQMVKINTALGLNDFYIDDTSEPDGMKLIQAKRNEGGFVDLVSSLAEEKVRNYFELDLLISGIKEIDADEEKGIDKAYIVLKGYAFDFRKSILPIDISVRNDNGIKYFRGLDPSSAEPVFTKVWGKINSTTTISSKTEESAWGEDIIKDSQKTFKEWVITGTAKDTYTFGDEKAGITMEEIKTALADREIYLADTKAKKIAYDADSAKGNGAGSATKPVADTKAAAGGFNF